MFVLKCEWIKYFFDLTQNYFILTANSTWNKRKTYICICVYICCAFTWPKIHICIKYIYTHRQKLSNSKLILNMKKCFVPKYWKFKFYYLHLTSFESSISVTEQRYYVTSVKASIYWRGVCFFTVAVWHFVKMSILNRILRSCALTEGNRFVFMGNPREDMCQEKDTLS